MLCKNTLWILWAVTMSIFLWLALNREFDWLAVALVVSSLVWYAILPRTTSR